MGFTCLYGLFSIIPESFIAKLCKSLPSPGDASSFQGRGFRPYAGSSLEICSKGITHTCNQELHRSIGNDGGITNDSIRISRIEKVFVETMVVIVYD